MVDPQSTENVGNAAGILHPHATATRATHGIGDRRLSSTLGLSETDQRLHGVVRIAEP
jgi:hypothetical protein